MRAATTLLTVGSRALRPIVVRGSGASAAAVASVVVASIVAPVMVGRSDEDVLPLATVSTAYSAERTKEQDAAFRKIVDFINEFEELESEFEMGKRKLQASCFHTKLDGYTEEKRMKDYAKGLDTLARSIHKKAKSPNYWVAMAENELALVQERGDPKHAIKLYERLLPQWVELAKNAFDTPYPSMDISQTIRANTYTTAGKLARLYSAAGNQEKAQEYAAEANQLIQQWGERQLPPVVIGSPMAGGIQQMPPPVGSRFS